MDLVSQMRARVAVQSGEFINNETFDAFTNQLAIEAKRVTGALYKHGTRCSITRSKQVKPAGAVDFCPTIEISLDIAQQDSKKEIVDIVMLRGRLYVSNENKQQFGTSPSLTNRFFDRIQSWKESSFQAPEGWSEISLEEAHTVFDTIIYQQLPPYQMSEYLNFIDGEKHSAETTRDRVEMAQINEKLGLDQPS